MTDEPKDAMLRYTKGDFKSIVDYFDRLKKDTTVNFVLIILPDKDDSCMVTLRILETSFTAFTQCVSLKR